MSTPRLVSPLLDNFIMGEPIYDKGGIRICPAMEQEKEEKFLVKIVSIPATQTQVDALLITGAYKDAESVNNYFAELADSVIKEADVLSKLANSGGFDGFTNMQVVPMDDGNGYDVYLLSPYRPTWDRVSQQKAVTQLDGYNLALDICAALSVARRAGYLFANLKPESISVSPSGSYHISDLGLIGLDYLQYNSLPTNYFSPYTAPEVTDAFSSLNGTLDVYALGMVLYEIFNCGLPFTGDHASAAEYPAPAYAEEEFAQIILKAIHPDRASRWQDPTEFGQAIVSVMQRKGVSDAPICPIPEASNDTAQEPSEEDSAMALAEEFLEQASVETEAPAEVAEDIEPVESVVTEEDGSQESAPISVIETVETESVQDSIETTQEEPIAEAAVAVEEVSTEIVTEADANEASEEIETIETDACEQVVDPIAEEKPDIAAEETPDTTTEETPDTTAEVEPISIDTAVDCDDSLDDILQEADKLIAELEIDENSMPTSEEYKQLILEETEVEEEPEEEPEVVTSPLIPSVEDPEEETVPKKSRKGKVAIFCSVVLIILLLIGGLFFYRHIYMQEIDILSVNGTADSISVAVVTTVESDQLSVVCTDASGKTFESKLVNYKATIAGLSPETSYTVTLKVDGFHTLYGQTEATYLTAEKTTVSDFTVLNGSEAGMAEVSFSLAGPNEGNWFVTFKTAGEEDQTATILNGKATVVGLTSGKTYTVTISNSSELYLDGELETTFTPGPVIKAIDPCVTSCTNNKISVQWSTTIAATWMVHCYNDDGFDVTVVADKPEAEINVPDDRKAYTIDITAMGQSVKESLSVSENSITLSDFSADTTVPGTITLSWSSSSDVPASGYVVTYSVDGVPAEDAYITHSNSVTITSALPNAAHTFTFAGANGESVLCAPIITTATGGDAYSGHGITANNLRYNICVRPSKSNWTQSDVTSYTTTFTAGQSASIVGRIISRYFTSDKMITTLYAFRDSNGKVAHLCSVVESWGDMWYNGYGYFDIPCLPETAGTYTMEIYYNGALAYDTQITIK